MADEIITLRLGAAEYKATWAALYAMVHDVHSPQDYLTDEEWEAAERQCEQMTMALDGRASKAETPEPYKPKYDTCPRCGIKMYDHLGETLQCPI